MPRGYALTVEEQSSILALGRAQKTLDEIVNIVKRSRTAVHTVLKVGRVRYRQKRRGAKAKLTPHLARNVVRTARTGRSTARQLRNQLAPSLSVRRIQQVLRDAPDLDWVKPVKAPLFTPTHKSRRLNFARAHLEKGSSHWRQIIFSDEKMFCLDGPDTAQSYWCDMRKGRRWQSKRQNGGGHVMVWGAFSHHGKSKLIFVDHRMNAVAYTELLEDALLPFLDDHPGNTTFQQDNAAPHTAVHTKEWLMDNCISVLEWPARSPDLNPIENLWGEMSRRVYAAGRQFDNLEDLKDAIVMAWDDLSSDYCRNLIRSMPRRCIKVVEKHGGHSGY